MGTLLIALAACDPTSGPSGRERAEVEIRALGTAESVALVTSTDFAVDGGGRVLLFQADTQRIDLPFDRDYPLDDRDRFFVQAGPAVEGDTASVRMEVRIDGRDWYDESATLGVGEPGVLAFAYRLNVPRF